MEGENKVMDNPTEKKDRFRVLLQQLELTEDAVMQHFEKAQIEKLAVDRKDKKWHFYFLFEKIIPCNIYLQFAHRLMHSFQHIAQVSFTIKVVDQTFSNQLFLDYWSQCIKEIDGISPMLLTLLNEQKPNINGNKVLVSSRNDTEARTLKEKYGGIISNIYESFGFPPLVLDAKVSEQSQTKEDFEQFVQANQKEDEERARQAVIEMQQQEISKNNGTEHSGPLSIGITIKPDEEIKKLEDIIDEERRITVQGYVFAAETRLRSGRTLLTFKITDYTDSISVKRFSRDKEDAEMLNRVKPGMWLKVRGSVQNDTFVRDLVMMVNDLTKLDPRLDWILPLKKKSAWNFTYSQIVRWIQLLLFRVMLPRLKSGGIRHLRLLTILLFNRSLKHIERGKKMM